MNIADIKNRLHEPAILSVLALSQYQPTPEKLASRAGAYQADPDVSAFACFERDTPIGTIVLKITVPNPLKSSVLPSNRTVETGESVQS